MYLSLSFHGHLMKPRARLFNARLVDRVLVEARVVHHEPGHCLHCARGHDVTKRTVAIKGADQGITALEVGHGEVVLIR